MSNPFINEDFSLKKIEGMTEKQVNTLAIASMLPQPFKTNDLAMHVNPLYYWRGVAFINDEGDYSADFKEGYRRYDFRRRAVLTTSQRLNSISKKGYVKRIKNKSSVLWEIIYPI